MSLIKEIQLEDGTSIYVEMEEVDFPSEPDRSSNRDLPPGATPVTAVDKVVDTLPVLSATLKAVFNIVQSSLKDNAPSEWGVELNIGFKGKANPIPIIVSGEGSVAIKVHAKWTRP